MANLAIFPLDGANYDADFSVMEGVWNGRERVTLNLPPRDLAKGEVIRSRFLVMLTQEPVDGPEALFRLKEEYTRRGELVKSVTAGKLLAADYVLDFEAADGAAVWEPAPWTGRDLIPFRVHGLNPNWSALVVQGDKMEAAEIDDGVLYGLAGSPEVETVTAGHPVLADHADAIVEWGDVFRGTIRLRVHNPTEQAMDLKLKTNPAFKNLPQQQGAIRLLPGESRFLQLQ